MRTTACMQLKAISRKYPHNRHYYHYHQYCNMIMPTFFSVKKLGNLEQVHISQFRCSLFPFLHVSTTCVYLREFTLPRDMSYK